MTIEKMMVIINIQNMQKIIKTKEYSFVNLESSSIETLRQLQDDLIPLYNIAIKTE